MQDALEIRKREYEDDDFILRLSASAFSDYSRRSGPNTLGFVRAESAHTFIAWRGSERIGFASIDCHGAQASLQAIAVIQSEKGRGVGACLLAAAETAARAQAARQLSLCTGEANVEALQLFLRSGFRIVRRLPSYYARGQNACALSKRLAPA
ncbi:MAG TPA: GNAT family N-acetyltransferase [Polyangiaceae bacterium]|nr:GNAT family N-acetyltransferase [Polyangiaceae bacterium]